MSDVRQAVLIDMCYNLGYSGLMKFKNMIKAFADGNFERAAIEMEDSRWYKQVGDRSERLKKMVLTSKWPV